MPRPCVVAARASPMCGSCDSASLLNDGASTCCAANGEKALWLSNSAEGDCAVIGAVGGDGCGGACVKL